MDDLYALESWPEILFVTGVLGGGPASLPGPATAGRSWPCGRERQQEESAACGGRVPRERAAWGRGVRTAVHPERRGRADDRTICLVRAAAQERRRYGARRSQCGGRREWQEACDRGR